MATELIISVSGMRGIVGETLTPAIAAEYACAFGSFLKASQKQSEHLKVCIGTDSRPSGQMLKDAVAAGLCDAGVDVIDLGLVTTPCVGIMTTHLACAGGVVITASHNTAQYNGIKLLLANGAAPPLDTAEKIRQNYFDKKLISLDPADRGKISSSDQTDAVHINKVLAIIEKDIIRAAKFKVVLDSVNGAGGRIGKKLLEELGCDVVAVNAEPTGIFAHTPEPIAENLTELCGLVKENSVDAGFALDPDADRLAIVDHTGRYIGEEYTLALAAKYIFSKKTGKAAANLSTSRMIDDIAASAAGQVIRTPVGEANVAEAMIKNDCVIGGEGNGGIIDLRVVPVRDSLVGMALVLQLMAETKKSIATLADEIPAYYMKKEKFDADKNQTDLIIATAKKTFTDAAVDTTDGCRLDFDDGWMHLRCSNTEPIMRVIAEAKTAQSLKKYLDIVADIRKEIIN